MEIRKKSTSKVDNTGYLKQKIIQGQERFELKNKQLTYRAGGEPAHSN